MTSYNEITSNFELIISNWTDFRSFHEMEFAYMTNNITSNAMKLISLNETITAFIHADNTPVDSLFNTSTPAIIYVPNIKELTSHNGKKTQCFKFLSIVFFSKTF